MILPGCISRKRKPFGVNGHYTTQDVYRNNNVLNFTWQAQAIKDFGFNYSRTDVITDANGIISNSSGSGFRWGRLLGGASDVTYGDYGMYHKLKANGIRLLIMLYDGISGDGWTTWSNQQLFDTGYAKAYGFVTTYKEVLNIEYLELGNEWELGFANAIKNGTGPGTLESHYYAERLKAKHHAAGMEAGAKAAMPKIKTVFNCAGWFPTYWVGEVLTLAPTIDIVGWHWYSEMQSLIEQGDLPDSPLLSSPGSTYTNIIDAVYEMWGKPIWFTEYGYRWSTAHTKEQNNIRQLDFFNKMHDLYRKDHRVVGMNWHELLDFYRVGTAHTSDEENFGLIGWDNYDTVKYDQWYYKDLAQQLMQ